MNDTGPRPLTGWQRAHVLSAAQYVRDLAKTRPDDPAAWVVYEQLLEVLEPTRRMAREYRDRQGAAPQGSMWDQRSGSERRRTVDRRALDATPPAGGERRGAQRRRGGDRRRSRS